MDRLKKQVLMKKLKKDLKKDKKNKKSKKRKRHGDKKAEDKIVKRQKREETVTVHGTHDKGTTVVRVEVKIEHKNEDRRGRKDSLQDVVHEDRRERKDSRQHVVLDKKRNEGNDDPKEQRTRDYRRQTSRHNDKRDEHRFNRNSTSRSSRRMTEEERKKKLEEMQSDALKHHEKKIERIKKRAIKDDLEANKDQRPADGSARHVNATFIDQMSQGVYTDNSTASLEDRVKRGIFYIEKRNLDEKGLLN